MTVLHCQPFVFHDTKIVGVNGAYVFDNTQLLAICVHWGGFAFEVSGMAFDFDRLCDTAHQHSVQPWLTLLGTSSQRFSWRLALESRCRRAFGTGVPGLAGSSFSGTRGVAHDRWTRHRGWHFYVPAGVIPANEAAPPNRGVDCGRSVAGVSPLLSCGTQGI